jgi:hypothetical protein
MLAQGFEVIGRGVALVPREAVLRVDRVPLFHTCVAMGLRKNRSRGDGDAARVPFDERLLLDENVELHGVDEQIIRLDGKLLQSGGHGLAAGLVNVPGIDALSIDFRDGPCNSVLVNPWSEFGTALSCEFFRIVETDNAPLGIENDGSSDDRAEERSTTGLVETGDAHPAKLSRLSLETGTAKSAHRAKILARRSEVFATRFP